MVPEFKLGKPFFEFGPKLYLYGDAILDLALHADRLAEKYGVDIICTVQYTDIERIASRVKKLRVFAQHMDPFPVGRGVGGVLAEALKFAGAQGVLLNHAERPLSNEVLKKTIRRADEVGLASLVCAGDADECVRVAALGPDIILAESPALIGAGQRGENDEAEIKAINRAVAQIGDFPILHAAGITDETDVYNVIRAGADGTGSTSGVINADDPKKMLSLMIEAVHTAYMERISIN